MFRRVCRGVVSTHRSNRRHLSSSSTGERARSGRETYGTFLEEWRKYRFPVALGFTCVALLQFRRVLNRPQTSMQVKDPQEVEEIDFGPTLPEAVVGFIEKGPPYRWMSNLWGKVAEAHLPFNWMKQVVYGGWAWMYDCNLKEMKFPLESYKSLSEFFLRPLKDGARRLDTDSPGALISPVDGRVLHVGTVDLDQATLMKIEAVKGNSYSFEEFVGKFPEGLSSSADIEAKKKSGGRKLQTIVLYLAPGDYHRFHSPADWTVLQRRHFPGKLLPVRPWAVLQVKDLYSKNERVVLNGKWEGGFFSFGAVGALNVGSIGIEFDSDVLTNQDASFPYQRPSFRMSQRDYVVPIPQVRGQPIGHFNLGSTIVLLFESSNVFQFQVKPGQVVRVGQRIGTDKPFERERGSILAPPWPGHDTVKLIKDKLEDIRNIPEP